MIGTERGAEPGGAGRAGWALLATSLGFGVVQLDVSVVNVAIRPIGADLGGGVSGLQWVGLIINVSFYGLIFVFSLYFQTTRHYSALRTGLAFAPATVAVCAGNLIAGRLTRAAAARRLLASGALLLAAGLGGLLVVSPGTCYPAIVAQLISVGFGLGLIVPVMTSALLGSAGPARSGVASGTLNTARQTGSVIGVGLFGSLAAGHLVSGLRLGLAVSVCLALTVAALALGLDRPGTRSETVTCRTGGRRGPYGRG